MDEVTTVATIQVSASSPTCQITIAIDRSSDTHPELQNGTSSSLPSNETTPSQQQTPTQSSSQEVIVSRDTAELHDANAEQPTEFELFIKESFEKLSLYERNPFAEFPSRKATRDEAAKQEEAKCNLARRRMKYLFRMPKTDDDDEQEEIDANLETLSNATERLKGLAVATGEEICIYPSICKPAQKGDPVDKHIVLNRARLDRIR